MKTKHKHADLIHAWADGEKIQYFDIDIDDWEDLATPAWSEYIEYRIKPQNWDETYDIRVSKLIDDVVVDIYVSVDSDLKPLVDKPTRNFGYIGISSVYTSNLEKVFWDNMSFFCSVGVEEMSKECKSDLDGAGLYKEGIFDYIKHVMDNMISRGYLIADDNY